MVIEKLNGVIGSVDKNLSTKKVNRGNDPLWSLVVMMTEEHVTHRMF